MHHNVNCPKLIPKMLSHSWSFDQIFVDHFKTQEPCFEHMLGEGFLKNLLRMAKTPILHKKASKSPRIYLPFTAHTFVMLIYKSISSKYAITYLTEEELDESDHVLHNATLSYKCERILRWHDLNYGFRNKYYTTTQWQVLEYKGGHFVTRNRLINHWNKIPDPTKVRCIVLTLKDTYRDRDVTKYKIPQHYCYIIDLSDLKSTYVITLNLHNPNRYLNLSLSPSIIPVENDIALVYLVDSLEYKCKTNTMRTQSRDKKLRKKFNCLWQVQVGRSIQALGCRNFSNPHNFINGKGVYMQNISDSKRTNWVKDVYKICQQIIRKIDYEYAGDNDDWVVNISAMTNTGHYIKKHTDKRDIDSQYAFTLGSFTGGILSSYNKLNIKKELNNYRRVVCFDGRLPHEVSAVVSGLRYSVIFYKVYDRRMTISAPILNNPKFVTNFIAPKL